MNTENLRNSVAAILAEIQNIEDGVLPPDIRINTKMIVTRNNRRFAQYSLKRQCSGVGPSCRPR